MCLESMCHDVACHCNMALHSCALCDQRYDFIIIIIIKLREYAAAGVCALSSLSIICKITCTNIIIIQNNRVHRIPRKSSKSCDQGDHHYEHFKFLVPIYNFNIIYINDRCFLTISATGLHLGILGHIQN